MKHKIEILLLFTFFAFNAYGQGTSSVYAVDCSQECLADTANAIIETPADFSYQQDWLEPYKQSPYWKKHKMQKIAGGVSLGVGILAVGYGLLYVAFDSAEGGGNDWIGKGILVSGGCLMLVSIPLFISAHKNKGKAFYFSMGSGRMISPSLNGTIHSQSTLALRFSF